MSEALNYNNKVGDPCIAGALMTLNFIPVIQARYHVLTDSDTASWQFHQISTCGQYSSTYLKHHHKSGALEQHHPQHPFLIGVRACQAAQDLADRVTCRDGLSPLPGMTQGVPAVSTTALPVASALIALGFPLLALSDAGSDRPRFLLGATSNAVVDPAPLLLDALHRQSLPPEHLLLCGIYSVRHMHTLLAETTRSGRKLVFQRPGTARSAVVTENAHGDLMAKAEKFIF